MHEKIVRCNKIKFKVIIRDAIKNHTSKKHIINNLSRNKCERLSGVSSTEAHVQMRVYIYIFVNISTNKGIRHYFQVNCNKKKIIIANAFDKPIYISESTRFETITNYSGCSTQRIVFLNCFILSTVLVESEILCIVIITYIITSHVSFKCDNLFMLIDVMLSRILRQILVARRIFGLRFKFKIAFQHEIKRKNVVFC